MAVEGIPVFDALAILEIEKVDYREGSPSLVAHAAFVNTKTGRTHGRTTGRQWSKETLAKLEELKESMEHDMARQHFVDTMATSSPSTVLPGKEPSGLAEFIEEGASSI